MPGEKSDGKCGRKRNPNEQLPVLVKSLKPNAVLIGKNMVMIACFLEVAMYFAQFFREC
jgi:hypothetical protein